MQAMLMIQILYHFILTIPQYYYIKQKTLLVKLHFLLMPRKQNLSITIKIIVAPLNHQKKRSCKLRRNHISRKGHRIDRERRKYQFFKKWNALNRLEKMFKSLLPTNLKKTYLKQLLNQLLYEVASWALKSSSKSY